MPGKDQDMGKIMAERFKTLPKVVQDAITSADVQAHMRDLAKVHKLHVDQWQILENNVMLTLLGFQPVAELTQHLEKDLEIDHETALALGTSISELVFAPIRGEMERALEHPEAAAQAVSGVEALGAEALQAEHAEEQPEQESQQAAVQEAPAAAPIQPATPPSPAPEGKADRAQVPQTYATTASHERKTIEGDPYREQIN